jgi:hypothetical protein
MPHSGEKIHFLLYIHQKKTMARIRLNEFEKNYGLNLLPVSLETFKVGHKVEWDNLVHTKFDIEESFFTKFLGIEKSREKVIAEKLVSLHASAPGAGSFLALDIEKSNQLKAALKIPRVGLDLGTKVNTEKVVKFSFEDIRVRSLHDEVRDELIELLLEIKSDKSLFKRIDSIMFVEKLFYAGSVSLTIEKGYESEIKSTLETMNIDFRLDTSGEVHRKITFTNSSVCPFAARFEKVSDLVD